MKYGEFTWKDFSQDMTNIFEFDNPQELGCAIHKYRLGMSFLQLQIHETIQNSIFVRFHGPCFYQGPTFWKGAVFGIGTRQKLTEILENIGLLKDVPDDARDEFIDEFTLFEVFTEVTNYPIQIVARSVSIMKDGSAD